MAMPRPLRLVLDLSCRSRSLKRDGGGCLRSIPGWLESVRTLKSSPGCWDLKIKLLILWWMVLVSGHKT